jgi:hypothetical protein
MRNAVVLGCALVLLGGSRALAEDTHESLTEEMLKTMDKANGILVTIKDKKTAEDARPKLREVGKTMQDLKKRADKLGKPPQKVEEQLTKKYKAKIEEAVKKMVTEANRVKDVEGGEAALKELQSPK